MVRNFDPLNMWLGVRFQTYASEKIQKERKNLPYIFQIYVPQQILIAAKWWCKLRTNIDKKKCHYLQKKNLISAKKLRQNIKIPKVPIFKVQTKQGDNNN